MKQFAVIGLGRFGSSVARTLTQMGYDVLAIDSDENKVEELADVVTHAVTASALEETVLKSLGVRNFDVVVVAIGQDIQSNILVTLMLKEMGVKKVVAKASTELQGKVLQKIGADIVVFPERDMGERVARWLVSRNIIDVINLSPDYSLVELAAPAEFHGTSLQDSGLRKKYGITVLAIRRGKEFIISPEARQIIEEGDVLIVLGSNEKLKLFETEG
ncbi:Trk system potassium uptake protein TrkA [Desulfocucumis palustris]|uniref:Trk system potassium uptake protein TrkA n=1 Tax=Desulfocucumis palustris TaxID=1898651 RepID=A0A2L2X9S6_9FIRM|nr:TrkA family potassium uptake protein [Desulfocucumis palustris]GBF32898.1 Trk system potassium uptake protein TrkA [Desulfocucumis palustris]